MYYFGNSNEEYASIPSLIYKRWPNDAATQSPPGGDPWDKPGSFMGSLARSGTGETNQQMMAQIRTEHKAISDLMQTLTADGHFFPPQTPQH